MSRAREVDMRALLSILILGLWVFVAAGCGKSDPTKPPEDGTIAEVETNDFVPQSVGTLSATDIIVAGATIAAADVDLYRVTASGTTNLFVKLDWSGSADQELAISNTNGIFVRKVDTAGHPESCTLSGLPAGSYTIRVGSFTDAQTDYTLTLGQR
jgi:hypothetical protein